MNLSVVENRRAYRAIVNQICDAILHGELRRGDRLPSERDIAAQTGLSRSSAREALKVLGDAGVVRVKTGGGRTEVISDSIPSELLGDAIEMSRRRLIDFCETRNLIELQAASLTAARATPQQIKQFDDVLARMEKFVHETPENRQAYVDIDVAFHRLLVQSTGNQVLLEIYTPLLRQILQISDMAEVAELHAYGLPSMQRFVKAVRERNPLEAQRAIDAHIQPLSQFFERSFDE